jgi:hypothetical protein
MKNPMKKFLMTCISVASLAVLSAPVRSDDLPVLNVLPLCRGIVSQSDAPLQAGTRSVTIDECMKAEQADRETMKQEWSTFSAADKKGCIAEATMGGESSYTDLVTCLEMARDVRKMKQPSVRTD